MAFYLIHINFINNLYTFKIWSTLKVNIQYDQVLLVKECVNVCISMSLLIRFKDLRIRERVCGALLGSEHNVFRNVVGTRDPQEHRNQTKKEG